MKMPIELHLLNFLLINDCVKEYYDFAKNFTITFAWFFTNEGCEYWFDINNKWHDYLKINEGNICD